MARGYIYHAKRPDFIGTRLYPLNELKERLPAVYENAVKKYQGREWLLNVTIPGLDALWNDVIHFSLMHPALIYKTLTKTGFTHHDYSLTWMEIPLDDVLKLPSALYLNIRVWQDTRVLLPSDFEPLSPERVDALSGMPAINLQYYKDCFSQGEKPLLWKRAPHVLVKGELDISGYRTFDWRE